MLIIWRTCRIWSRTEWSVQIEHISTSTMYQNGQCIKLSDHERWQLLHSTWVLLFKCTILFLSPFTAHLSAGLIQIRGCRADAHRASWRKASRFWEVPWEIPVFSVWKRWRKCGDALTWWSRHKEAWIFWRRFQSLPHVRVVVSPSPEKLQQNPMKDERVCRLFQVSMF